MRGENEVTDEKSEPVIKPWKWTNKNRECPEAALQSMGNRLLDWFSVIMADNKRRRTDYKGKGEYRVLWSYNMCNTDKHACSKVLFPQTKSSGMNG